MATRSVPSDWAVLLWAMAGMFTACGGGVAGTAATSCGGLLCADANDHDALGGTTSQADGFSGVNARADVLPDIGSELASTLVDSADPGTKPDASHVPSDVEAGAVVDASPDTGVDASGILTTAQLLKNVSADCYNCAMAHCPSRCESLVGDATSGAAIGTSKRLLCLETLTCEFQNGCFVGDRGVAACYCGSATQSTCWSQTTANGPCMQEWERSLEDTYPTTLLQRIIDSEYGGGIANRLAQCLHDNHCFCD